MQPTRKTSALLHRVTDNGRGLPSAAVIILPTHEEVTNAFKRQLRANIAKAVTEGLGGCSKTLFDDITDAVIDTLMDFEPTKPRRKRVPDHSNQGHQP